MAWCPYVSAGAGVPASAQYEQNMFIGIRRRRDIIVFHSAPETAVLNLGSRMARSLSLASSSRQDSR